MDIYNVLAGENTGPGGGNPTVADAPTNVVATVISATQVQLTFNHDGINGGSPIYQFAAISLPGGFGYVLSQSTPATITINGSFAFGTSYFWRIYAYNSVGISDYGQSNTVTPYPLPQGQLTYSYIGSSYSWTVPNLVNSISVLVIGSGGQAFGTLSGGGGGGGQGGPGVIRIIWPGQTRSYPNTGTGDLPTISY
jgi:hypothetical protein